MTMAIQQTPFPATKVHAMPANAVLRAIALLIRLALVLLLVVDQVGAPLHAHHHDFGIDGLALADVHAHNAAEVHDGNTVDALHVDGCQGIGNGHSVLALRVEGRTVIASAEKSDADQQHAAFVALLMAVGAPSVDIRRQPDDWPRQAAPLYFTGVIRPQVRAPPLRA
ncbi:TPA: hypothetical protein L4S95_002463 [Pseudomonas aeruginosa]|nr:MULTISPECIES: hypothetical protein [Pseudomonadota]MCO1984157.1 hypothetical protein [Pseudomonas aeruginosa]MCW3523271.1 hypothetical protein [Burkholderia cenocepacia]MCW3612703.1 hypothetical protein [Burkholderia cenocepacia]MCW3650541.1 hypothetical protein [Burkholderia cenocepacia]MCW3664862.1 hypothetical protein [Burkholderia cenocepacia]